MNRINLSLLFVLFISLFCSASAAEFGWFNVSGFEGWAEKETANPTDNKKIYVLPRLFGPTSFGQFGVNGPDTTKLLSISPDGSVVVKYHLSSNLKILPATFKEDVYKVISGSNPTTTALANYSVEFVRPRNLSFHLVANGKEIQIKQLNNSLSESDYKNEFSAVAFDDESYSYIKNGNFKIEAKYSFPYQQFSSVTLNLSETSITNIQVETFKQVIQSSSSSGGSLFLFNWRNTYVRNIERERTSSNSSSSYSSNLSIVLRDPDETILKILDEFMGSAKLTKEKFLENHRLLSEKAFAQNNPKLGDISKRYIEAVQNNDEAAQIDVLKAAAALAKGDVLSFMAAGIRFSDNSVYGNSTYLGIFNATISSENRQNYSAILIKTLDASFYQSIEDFGFIGQLIYQLEERQNFELFGTALPTPQMLNGSLLGYVKNNNLVNAVICLKKGADVNFSDFLGDTSLIIATRNQNQKVVELLLKNGADPNLKNRDGENSLIVAENDNNASISSLLNQYKDRKGKISLKIKKPAQVEFEQIAATLNTKKIDFVFEKNPTGEFITSNSVSLFPSKYNLLVSGQIKVFIQNSNNSQQSHFSMLQKGFTFQQYLNGLVYSKKLELFLPIKSINNVTNQYELEIVCGNFDCSQKFSDIFIP